MAQTWMNSDGLYIKFGSTEGTVGTAGEYTTYGPQRLVELTIADMTTLGTAAAIQDDNTWLPSGARIESVEVIVVTACTGTGALLNIGLQREDRSTELDYDGLVAAATKASLDTAGKTQLIATGSTFAGALLGTTLANKGYITCDYDTAAFTAGKIVIRIRYSVPTT